MKRSRFSEEQIAYALRLAESGTPVVDVCCQIGVSEPLINNCAAGCGQHGTAVRLRISDGRSKTTQTAGNPRSSGPRDGQSVAGGSSEK